MRTQKARILSNNVPTYNANVNMKADGAARRETYIIFDATTAL
jgi:hypothetical protein